jgi:uncharacterized protein (TIGR04255 family)
MPIMVIKEVFPNPTVKEVIFAVEFPDLFFIENKIGELQLKVLELFPDSQLVYQRQFMIVGKRIEEEVKTPSPEEFGKKIWILKSEKNFQVEVTSKKLGIVSGFHKTYDLEGGEKFRDIIKFVVDNFLATISIPTFNRIGLRYVDECPLPTKDNATLKSYYNSAFPVDRFNFANAQEMFFRTVEKRGDLNITYMEELREVENNYKLVLDFDGFALKIPSNAYLEVTDRLHGLISETYEQSIKEPVYQYMRKENV